MDIYYLECDGGKIHPSYFKELNKILGPNGFDICYKMKNAPHELSYKMENLEPSLYSAARCIKEAFGCIPQNSSMIVFSTQNSTLRELSLKENKLAKWGASAKFGDNLKFGFSVTYTDENILNLQLHETLHLFGVDDCYIVNERNRIIPHPDCNNHSCIMRFACPSLKTCKRVKTALLNYKNNQSKK